ncbi:hypothetical protein G7067_06295 [Leucobacter insecticola]|uniref:SURF1-like protein n=2 Tax=Leucobacter insecticola TaxID=2714934 RepID=A0A6G8FLQ6_9MICO|nr:hypothetical protein G7067_06295 [Leucobacter insecticola]
MRRPRWVLAFLLAMLVAAAFAWLGQWQMSNAIRSSSDPVVDTEAIQPLSEVADTGIGVTEAGAGVVVRVRGSFVPGDSRLLSPRQNGGETGTWVVGRFVTEAPEGEPGSNLAVAIAWAPDAAAAQRALEEFDRDPEFVSSRLLEGRYMPAEAAQVPREDEDPQTLKSMLPAHLANLWTDVDSPVYAGYLVMHSQAGGTELLLGLDPIDSVAPTPPEKVSWLNVFYAVEWVVFAGFAVFFWFRLARDAWEKEHELKLLSQAEPEPSDPH